MKSIVIAAGGTGGHINAAIGLKESFEKLYQVSFISGDRYLDYALFKNKDVTHYSGKPLRSKNPLVLLKNLVLNSSVFIKILLKFIQKRPRAVIGTGGYICGPSLLAAKLLAIPIFIVEQNAAAGVTNKILAKFSNKVFISFRETLGIRKGPKVILSGNPIRKSISFKENKINEKINVLIFGGSLGARQLNETARLLAENPSLNIWHQVGKNNDFKLESSNYKQVEYISDMQKAYDWSNVIVSRSGASSVSELEIIKKPVLFIPYRYATDNHQYLNAKDLQKRDIFKVEIIDPTLEDKAIAVKVNESIDQIITEKDFYPYKNEELKNAAQIIKDEIHAYIK